MRQFDDTEWYRVFGWSDNPFKIKPSPENIVGFVDMRTKILTYMDSEDPFIVTGNTGAGKTTLLKWVKSQKKNAIYFNFLDDIEEKKFKKKINGNFIDRLVRHFSGTKRMVLIDEAQEMSPKLIKWIRGKFDNGEVSSLVLASIQKDLANLEEPFVDRIGNRIVTVRKLEKDEAKDMIEKRISKKGEKNPFNEESLTAIFEYSGYLPRKILENCELCCISAVRNGMMYVSKEIVEKSLKGSEEIKKDFEKKKKEEKKESNSSIGDLSPKQQEIVKALFEKDMTTKKLADLLKVSRASVAKQLSRLSFKTDSNLMESKGFYSPLVEQKNKGRPVVYGLTEEGKKIL